ncbi:MAG TPA: FAD-binding oxidoreductase [Caulobacteraceae bacterium]|jgi:alkyldihydroxyacetonephosphate synthase|nr:FAD-binding oxidoreductase [Caulobacteraceae bacterium]
MARPIVKSLVDALGPDKVRTDEASRDARRHDYWVLSHLHDFLGAPGPPAACVVRPADVADVQAVLRLTREAGASVTPFGLGSGVVGGVLAGAETVILDMGAMSATRLIDETNLLAAFDAGKNGLEAEQAVAARGLTIGHWPQSVAISSVGGWVATRASGQFSTANGNIEDIVYAIEAVLPDGEVVVLGRGPRASAGPDLRHLMLGSEGTLGVVTGVTFSLRRAPETRAISAFAAPDMASGFAFQRELIQSGWRPPVVRQYDEREAARLDARAESCLVLLVHEGPAGLVAAETAAVAGFAARHGLTPAPSDIVEHWLEHRNTVPTWASFLARNIIIDTVEVSAPWSEIGAVYEDAVAALAAIPGCLNGSAHSSHAYRSGLNLYFSFAIRTDEPEQMEGAYLAAWDAIMRATDAHGGSLAHHHGIGRIRAPWLERELGPGGIGLLRKLKHALDPGGMMNPGTLFPDA